MGLEDAIDYKESIKFFNDIGISKEEYSVRLRNYGNTLYLHYYMEGNLRCDTLGKLYLSIKTPNERTVSASTLMSEIISILEKAMTREEIILYLRLN